ncbi:MAG: right-handed parallel beta-helix repeat-containing protein [Erythrobacter sp.]|nr:right-handed parallel beta-helix repeat-containing protein [Erythrobacter sp.]
MKTRPFLVAALAAVTFPLSAQQSAPFTVAETGRGYGSLQDAVDAIGGGEGTVVFAPGTYRECAVQRAGRVTYRASEPGQSALSGVACESKGALVLGGESATVIGLVFSDIAVPDRNGAGIRLERGELAVTQSWFRDSEQGILTAHDPNIRLRVDKSTFTRLGTCEGDGGCAHSIYTGEIAETAVTRSRFEAGTGGHYVKSRAARTIVEDSSFDDANGRGTNYMIDLPNGGTGRIVGNWFVQGRDKKNWSAFIAVGAEQANYSSDGLVISDNDARLVPGLSRSPAFVADWTGDRLQIGRNDLGAGLKPFDRR